MKENYQYEWQPDLEISIIELLDRAGIEHDREQEQDQLAVYNVIAQDVSSNESY